MKALQIIESAYRCTIEEQDDPAVWISHAMKNAGAQIGVLLRGNAVNYAVKHQDASGLVFGDKQHDHPPCLDSEIERFVQSGVAVFLVNEDVVERGIQAKELIAGVESVARSRLPSLFSDYEAIWHW